MTFGDHLWAAKLPSQLVLSFPDKDGTPLPPPPAAMRAINLMRRNEPLPLRAFLMISHHFFGEWPAIKLYDDARAALEGALCSSVRRVWC